MSVEYWNKEKQEWRPASLVWDADSIKAANEIVGWEMYREAE